MNEHFNAREVAANRSSRMVAETIGQSGMETETIENGAVPKSQRVGRNFLIFSMASSSRMVAEPIGKSGMETETIENGANLKSRRVGRIFLMFSILLFSFCTFTNKAVGQQFAGGSGTEADPYLISTPEHLVELVYYLGNANMHFKLSNDIDLTSYLASGGAGHNGGAGWNPIGNNANRFYGTFNGAGFKITGLWINRSSTNYIGLFGGTDGANISNLGIEIANSGISGNYAVGGLVGSCENTTISNCYVTGNVTGNNAGGLVGVGSISSTIVNCHSTSNVSREGSTGGVEGNSGGLVGSSYSSAITNCYATGNVSANNRGNIGGLVGSANGPITNCYATGSVTGSNNYPDNGIGGLAGSASGTITNCYATGNVSSNRGCIGGLMGISSNNISVSYATGNISTGGDGYAGGLIGLNYASISKCYATGNVSGNTDVGGLVGYSNALSGTITNCYATIGKVSGNTYVGGFIGRTIFGTITNCYATGNVSGNTYVGGFAGFGGNINNSFFDYQTTGQLYAIGSGGGSVIGKPTSEMQTKSTFTSVGWDFTTVWGINEGVTYPFFIDAGTTDIDETLVNHLQLFPNPTNSQIRITNHKLRNDSDIEIFDVVGCNVGTYRIRPENNEIVIDISHLANGMYFLKIDGKTMKVVKQ